MQFRSFVACLACFAIGVAVGSLAVISPKAASSQRGQIEQSDTGEEVAVLRYLRIKKGTFGQVYRLGADGIWPYYERAGVRLVGMWHVAYPDVPGQSLRESPDYDEAYLLTRYASLEHWQATRDAQIENVGGSGPELARMRESLKQRQALTTESRIVVLRGRLASNGPYFYRPVPKK